VPSILTLRYFRDIYTTYISLVVRERSLQGLTSVQILMNWLEVAAADITQFYA